jgi:hypothetical protein
LIGDQISGKVLTGIGETGDQRSPEIGTLEEVEVGGIAAELGLDFNSSLNHGKNVSGVLFACAVQSFDRSKSLLRSTASSEPVWRFRSKEDDCKQGDTG